MSFRVIEKRDDNTTVAILEDNTETLGKKVSSYFNIPNRTNCKSNQYSKYLTKNENEQKSQFIKSNKKDLKLNIQENQSNYINKDTKILQSKQIFNNSISLPTIPSTKLSNILPTNQIIKPNFLPKIQSNNKNYSEQNEQKAKKTNTETNSGFNTTQSNQANKKTFIEQSFSKEKKPNTQTAQANNKLTENIKSNATNIEQTNNNLNIKHTFSNKVKQNTTEAEQKDKKLNIEQQNTNSNTTEAEQTNTKLNTEQQNTNSNTTETEQTNTKLNTEQQNKNSGDIKSSSISNPRFNFSRSYTYVRRKLLPPQLPSQENQITLVLDLDETLVHSIFAPTSHCDFSFITDPRHHISVFIRPGVKEFIRQVGNLFELVLFTVGNNIYADRIIDFIDPHHMIKHRLYRNSCTYLNGNFVKDLSRLGRDLNKVIILDDSPLSYKLQPKNALPISSWIDDPDDNELINIQNFLIQNHTADNVYVILNEYRKKFLKICSRKRNKKRKCISTFNKK